MPVDATHDETASLGGALRASGRPCGAKTILAVEPLSGGASRQTFRVSAEHLDGSVDQYIWQRSMAEPRHAEGMATEAAVMIAARVAGVRCPVVVGANPPDLRHADHDRIGRSYLITEAMAGESIARRILRDDRYATARQRLTGDLAQALATLHNSVDAKALPGLEAIDQLAAYRERYDELGLVSAAFELAFERLERSRPEATREVVVHGDFRLGNLLVDEHGLVAVLDWELAHRGDPMEDLGWLCVRAWRFGAPHPVAGVGEYEPFFAAYEEATEAEVDRSAVAWWELMGSLKWGIMCGAQAERYWTGERQTTEMLAIGNRIAEQEHDVLRLLGARFPDRPIGVLVENEERPGFRLGLAEGGARASAPDLLEAVERMLRETPRTSTERFANLVAANAIAAARRDVQLAPVLAAEREALLASLGVESETELAAKIRTGHLDLNRQLVLDAVAALVTGRVVINNPSWLD